MPTNLRDEIAQRMREGIERKRQDALPQWNGYAWTRKRNPINMEALLQACKPIPKDKQTDAYLLLKRFYKINQFTIPQNTKLFRIPHLQGNRFWRNIGCSIVTSA